MAQESLRDVQLAGICVLKSTWTEQPDVGSFKARLSWHAKLALGAQACSFKIVSTPNLLGTPHTVPVAACTRPADFEGRDAPWVSLLPLLCHFLARCWHMLDSSNTAALTPRSKPLHGNLDVQGCSKDDVPSDALSALLKLGG